MIHKPTQDYFNRLTSSQKVEQLYLWNKDDNEFWWGERYKANRGSNSIMLNRSYKFSDESWYDFIQRIERRIK